MWQITSSPRQLYTVTPAPPAWLSFGALTEILALALAARNKRSLSDEGKKIGTEAIFGAAFAFHPLILCPDAGTEWKSRIVQGR